MTSLRETIFEMADNLELNPSLKSRNFLRKIAIAMEKDIEYPLIGGAQSCKIPNGSGGYILLRFDGRGHPDLNQLRKLSNA